MRAGIDRVINYDYDQGVKTSEFMRWLRKQGVTFGSGKGSHQSVILGDRRSTIPVHPAKEIGNGLVEKIKKD